MAAETLHADDMTPAERRRRRVRDAIIGAAEAIFTEEGEAGISMRRIAERIDYSPAALYKYFDSKDALFDEIREQFFERLLRRLDETLCDNDLGAVCKSCLRVYIETGLEEPNHYLMAFSHWGDHSKPEEDSFSFAAARTLEQMIEDGVAQGLFRSDLNPKLAAKSIWASLHGLTMLLVGIADFPEGMPGSEHVTRSHVIEMHLDMMMRSMSA